MKDYKKDYLNIKATDELKERIDFIMEKNTSKKQGNFKKKFAVIAASLLIFIGTANVSPSLARATSDIPVLGKFINIVTLGRFEYDDDNFHANIATPQIEGLLDKDLEKELNETFKENADALKAAFEKDIRELKAEFGENPGHMGIDSDYKIRTNNEDFVSIDLYTVNTAASSSTVHSFYTIDKHSNELLELADLFEDKADYVKPISQYILGEMERQIKEEEDMIYWIENNGEEMDLGDENFKEIAKDQDFYINDLNQLVISFDKYTVAPGYMGNPEFAIPFEVISNIVANSNIK